MTTNQPPFIRSHRPLIMGRNGAVASNHPVATQAGLDVLRAGGNAVDAALATALTLGVVEPHMSGIGGDGFYHLFDGRTGRSRVFNGTGAAPAAATAGHYRGLAGGIPEFGALSLSVPGSVAGLAMMHAAAGSKEWGALFGPAVSAARDGFAATHAYRHFARENRRRTGPDRRSAAVFLGADGDAPALGALVCQPDLAATLETLARAGADDFYRGGLAARIAAGVAEAGGLMDAADLAACRAEEVEAISITYRGYEVRQTPPNSTGFTMLQMLKIIEGHDLEALGWGTAELVHLMVEAKKRAFVDRERHGADPRHRAIPLDRLLSADYAASLSAGIDAGRAADLPVAGERADGNTTYFCIVDGAGNAVSAIQSINSAFGSGVTAGDTGILMNNRLCYWHLDAGHANLLTPGRRVRHTMNAPVIVKDGKLWGVLGTPGADNQVQVNLQAVVGMIDFGLDPQQALEAPRWTSVQLGQEANYPHTGADRLTVERGLGEAAIAGLRARGHKVEVVGDYEGPCSVEAIRLLDNGVRMAASDPRRDGWAGAY
ncbi:gamma-glutamyltranspeptidase/glutathione hydrolase [Stella humosa]|uniref:Glutathione hydrolase proenzyme n=1 Tax=Stella humosa TaxID=94 RepID=A0A3N1KR83_9PROT|nr:gamma-glutamyltransferase [Stella humosa]ROP80838.1 gamma-glutamyltranspeptidase/glutathione hydrolase [Stella humosa]